MKIIIILFGFFSIGFCQYKLCIGPEYEKYCDDISKDDKIECVKVIDSVDCINKILKDEADFGRFDSEQVHLIAGQDTQQISVIAENRAKDLENRKYAFQMVVVVRNTHTGGLNGLRGKKYCHPGFHDHQAWTPRVLKEFEYVLFKDQLAQSCKNKENSSYIEREFNILSSFFGESCRAGPWTRDIDLDKQLVRNYTKLIALCDGNGNTSPGNSLDCMLHKNADIAYTTLEEAQKLTDQNNYRILCRNGELTNITRDIVRPDCSWRNQPWPLIAGKSEKAADIQNKLKTWIDREYWAVTVGVTPFTNNRGISNPSRIDALVQVLLNDDYRINIFNETTYVQDFLKKNNQNLDINIQADCPMRWCTISEQEQDKCKWLARASLYTGIEPQISCIAGDHIYDCLRKVRDNNADVLAIDSNHGYLARKVHLHNLLYSQSSRTDVASIIAVIREDSSIKTFKDLKNVKACFPEYRGLSWISFIESARRHKVIKNNCKFGKSVSDFFGGVCAPGAIDQYHYRQKNEEYKKLCSLCSENCQANLDNPYFNDKGALSCLANNNADVAFVEWQAIEKEPNLDNYRIICDNEEIIPLSSFKTRQSTCALSNTVDSEIIVRFNDSRKVDYKHGLLEMDKFFGSAFRNSKVFNMFKAFNGIDGHLFKANVLGFDDDSSDNEYVKNYIKLFEKVDECTSNAQATIASTITLLICSLIVLITRHD